MKTRTLLAALALGGLAVASGPASASFMLTNTAGTFTVDEFDWASTGAAWTVGFTGVAGSTFTLNYVDYATEVNNLGSGVIGSAQGLDVTPDGVNNGYQYTIVATLTEEIDPTIGCFTVSGTTSCAFDVVSGTFTIYYNTTGVMNKGAGTTTWTGFNAGTDIISGLISPSGPTFFTVSGTTGSGIATLFGTTTFQDTAFVNPSLDGTTATTTLQIGKAAGNFICPTSVDGTVLPPHPPEVCFKGDSNQQFQNKVPEPGSLALMGLALSLAALGRRRNKS